MTDEQINFGLGVAYNVFSLGYRLPQLWKMWKTKKASDLSVVMIIVQSLSYVIAIIYGIRIDDWVWILSSSLALFQNMIIYAYRWWLIGKQIPLPQ